MPFESRISQGTITIGWTDRDGSSFGSCMAYALLGGPRSVPVFVCGSFFVHHTLREVGEIPTYKLMWDEHSAQTAVPQRGSLFLQNVHTKYPFPHKETSGFTLVKGSYGGAFSAFDPFSARAPRVDLAVLVLPRPLMPHSSDGKKRRLHV